MRRARIILLSTLALVALAPLTGCKKFISSLRPHATHDAGAPTVALTTTTTTSTTHGSGASGADEADEADKKAMTLNETGCLGGNAGKCNDLGIN
jgi:hypothetical protein